MSKYVDIPVIYFRFDLGIEEGGMGFSLVVPTFPATRDLFLAPAEEPAPTNNLFPGVGADLVASFALQDQWVATSFFGSLV